MIDFEEFKLANGLHVIVHQDPTSPIVCLNLLYKVGSKNEDPEKTGFAHLFEHLMFGGSANIPSFDQPLQAVGGDNNAFTNADITNYYTMVPTSNVETAFWLESDRMLSLSFDPEVLNVQRSVVIEEFKQRYLNQPYGDLWLKLSPEAYKVHPYRWPTIGKEVSHIENTTMDDVKTFFHQHYAPNNAVLVISGDIGIDQAQSLSEKWFGPIPNRKIRESNIPIEPAQNAPRMLEITGQVPQNALYKVYHMPGRNQKGYHACDLLGDILGRGKSSLLHQHFVKDKRLMTSISAHVTGYADPGLLVIQGRLSDGNFEKADTALKEVLADLKNEIREEDVEKMKNLSESSNIFGEVELLNRAMGLAFSAFLGDTQLVNNEIKLIRAVSREEIIKQAEHVLSETNCTTLYYRKE